MDDAVPKSQDRRETAIAVAAAIAFGVAVFATWRFDLGWTGAILSTVALAFLILALFQIGQRRAIDRGDFSPAMARYNRRMLLAGAAYVVGLFFAIWAHDNLGLSSAAAFAIALAPAVGVLWMVWAMGRLVAEEEDEYLRFKLVRAALVGLGGLLTLATIWGFFEQFDLVPHVPTWAAVPIFALGFGAANCMRWSRS